MISGGVTRTFGVLAADSSMYDTVSGQMIFEVPKLYSTSKTGHLLSFIGTALYFNGFPEKSYNEPFDVFVKQLSAWLLEKRPVVAKQMEDAIADSHENKPNLCVFAMGMHKGYPTLAQLNSFFDFEPKYLWTENEPKFSTILYGDDSKPEKAALFKDATEYVELKAKQYETLTPGLMGEILTRGIYRKADQEMKIGLKKKYAGGVVNVGVVMSKGSYSLSGLNSIGG